MKKLDGDNKMVLFADKDGAIGEEELGKMMEQLGQPMSRHVESMKNMSWTPCFAIRFT